MFNFYFLSILLGMPPDEDTTPTAPMADSSRGSPIFHAQRSRVSTL